MKLPNFADIDLKIDNDQIPREEWENEFSLLPSIPIAPHWNRRDESPFLRQSSYHQPGPSNACRPN